MDLASVCAVCVVVPKPSDQLFILRVLAEPPGHSVANNTAKLARAARDEPFYGARFSESCLESNRGKSHLLNQKPDEPVPERKWLVRAVHWFAQRDDPGCPHQGLELKEIRCIPIGFDRAQGNRSRGGPFPECFWRLLRTGHAGSTN